MTTPDLEKLLEQKSNRLTKAESTRAHNWARTALYRLHRADYDALLEQAKAKIIAERNGGAK
jgi:hypothetical protein